MTPLSCVHMDYLRGMNQGEEFSLTYAPSNTYKAFRGLMEAKVCKKASVQFEGDSQVYDFIRITPYGKQIVSELS